RHELRQRLRIAALPVLQMTGNRANTFPAVSWSTGVPRQAHRLTRGSFTREGHGCTPVCGFKRAAWLENSRDCVSLSRRYDAGNSHSWLPAAQEQSVSSIRDLEWAARPLRIESV